MCADEALHGDRANGYERAADAFMANRSRIGADQVERWARALPPGSRVLDLGCGYGGPITQALDAAGVKIFGVDASPRLIAQFRVRWPNATTECSTVEESDFFNTTFDGAVAWGVVFLLAPEAQRQLIHRTGSTLRPGGRFLFTAPPVPCEWPDLLTGRASVSLGVEAYREILESAGMQLLGEEDDEGGNHYYHAEVQ